MKTRFAFLAVLFLVSTQARADLDKPVLDQKLSQSKLEQLLPKYVAVAEKGAEKLPSPTDNMDLRGIAYDVTNPTYAAFKNGKIVGLQSHTIDSIIRELEHAVNVLKQRTSQERREEFQMVLEGFKDRKNTRVSCRLGYLNSSKMADDRIVKCVDNQSQTGPGEEGYMDVRTIILSIDAKTLEPVSLLRIDQYQAG